MKLDKNALQLTDSKLHETSRTQPAGQPSLNHAGKGTCQTITRLKGAGWVLLYNNYECKMSKIIHIRKKGRSISMIITDDYGDSLGLNIFGNTTTMYPINPDLAEAIIGTLTEYLKIKIGDGNENRR